MVCSSPPCHGSEFVRAAVQAYADGKITDKEWPAPDKFNTREHRIAPSFVKQGAVSGPDTARTDAARAQYSSKTLGVFLGLTKKNKTHGDEVEAVSRLQLALDCLELIELKYMRDSDVRVFNFCNMQGELPAVEIQCCPSRTERFGPGIRRTGSSPAGIPCSVPAIPSRRDLRDQLGCAFVLQ